MKYLKEKNQIKLDEKFIDALKNYNEGERQESNIIEKREYFTYGTTLSMNGDEEIKTLIALCEECIDQTKEILSGANLKN